MSKSVALVKGGRRLLQLNLVNRPVLKSIRRNLRNVRGFEAILDRSSTLRRLALDLMDRVSHQLEAYGRMEYRCGKFNGYAAELLIIKDYPILKEIGETASITIAYRRLQMAAHHVIEAARFAKREKDFKLLATKTKDGLWGSERNMPAIALFQELHGLSPATLEKAYMMKMVDGKDLNLVENFTPALTRFVDAKEAANPTAGLADLFRWHKEFYATTMNERFFRDRLYFRGQGGKSIGRSLEQWFDEMIKLADEVDGELANVP